MLAGMNQRTTRRLMPLGEGIYSVSEVCRILQPTMTPRRVHYWIDTELIGEPLNHGGLGHPTLLSFEQLLKVRTVQHIKDELGVSLPRVREAFTWILDHVFGTRSLSVRFARGQRGRVVVRAGEETFELAIQQGILEGTLPELNRHLRETEKAWDEKLFVIPGRPRLVSSARILSGAPVIRGTRVETALIASFADDHQISPQGLREVQKLYRGLPKAAIRDALEFEGIRIAA